MNSNVIISLKSDFKAYKYNKELLLKLKLDLIEVDTKLYEVRAIQYDKDSTVHADQAEINELKRKWEDKRDRIMIQMRMCEVKILNVESIIGEMKEEDAQIIKDHFFEGMTYPDLADKYHYSERNMRYIVDKVLYIAFQHKVNKV